MQRMTVDDKLCVRLRRVAGLEDSSLDSARTAWPNIQVSIEQFRGHLQRCGIDVGTKELHLPDLYLVCGCILGDQAAILALGELLSFVPTIVRKLDSNPAFADDVRAAVTENLLVGGVGKAPKLLKYSGEGALRSWLIVVVQHSALAMLKGNKHAERPAALDDLALVLSGRFEPEEELLRAKFLPELRRAMRDAAQVLSPRERLVLRLSFSDGVTMQVIANSYRVNQSTVSRWISRALESWHIEAHRLLSERHGLETADVESLVGAIRSRVEVSLSSLLAGTISIPPR
jgi:RNA polymerase sigma-70 factor, ECF subfamily